MPKGCAESTVYRCAACPGLSSRGSKAIVVKMCLRMTILPKCDTCHPTQALFARLVIPNRAPSPVRDLLLARVTRILILICPLETDLSGRRPNLEHRTASIQPPLRVQRPRTPLAAFAGHMDVREVGSNVVPVAQVHA